MSDFKLMNSLLNPVVVVEAEVPAAPTETVSIDEVTRHGKYTGSVFRFVLYVTYTHPNLPEDLYLVVGANLRGEYTSEDNSFDYEYGSERGTHGGVDEYLTDLAWENVEVPQVADNMDLFKMEPEQVQHVVSVVSNYLTNMSEDEIGKHVNLEELTALAKS